MKYIRTYENLQNEGIHPENFDNFFAAFNSNDLNGVKKMIDKGVNVNYKFGNVNDTPLTYIIYHYNDCLEIVKELVKAGADVNMGDDDGMTPLMCAILKNNITIFDFLIDLDNIDINKSDDDDLRNPLMLAASDDRPDMVRKLINAGADMFLKDSCDQDFHDYANGKTLKMIEEEYPEFIAAKKYNL